MDPTLLVVQAITGDRNAFIELIRQLENSLHYMAKSIVGKDEDVADALQETILKAYKSIHTLREPKFFKTWIFRILINECHTLLAGRSRTVVYAEVPVSSSPSAEYDNVDLREAVDRLDEQQRIVVILHYFEDLPTRQVAGILNISESAVKMRLSRARETLLKYFKILREGKMNYGPI
ncbi:sigma-70 family RNA polymerase sigma factor [Paenibacillus sp. YPG26]|uniref:sigma-70 family RNA polymerase sigma factor n=1 Tax=Paenibacillus sp. YPG26 TaxID=2878915 RepID=UPI00203B5E82|nr:sigma-70 family RNA polymerase sigma factor [Paenibacillus sp. YPG26]USB33118.1 sigma-70 family RNA polymerase sigma factor [Paenibacillus sp. YPG26]